MKASNSKSWPQMLAAAWLMCVTGTVCLAQNAPNPDSASFDPDGTAHITRVLPLPRGVSPEAQALLSTGVSWSPTQSSAEGQAAIKKARELYPVKIEEDKILGGVKTKFVTPAKGVPAAKKDRVLINLHGGGMSSDSGSYVESIPIAALTETLVVSVDYRLAPPAHFPEPVDDVIAVYKELLKTYKPNKIGIYGSSAGGALTAQSVVRIRHDGLPQPAVVGLFSVHVDITTVGDSDSLYGVAGLAGASVGNPNVKRRAWLGKADPRDPLVSPIFADLKGFPSTLLITGTRDITLSGTATFHRALRKAGVDTELVVFEAMPHTFWYTVGIPESSEALEIQAKYLDQKLGK
jgi:monoterpene epsilon-lactone hydrolase